MTPEDKHKIHNVKTAMVKGMGATRRSMFFLLDCVEGLEKAVQILEHEIKHKDTQLAFYKDRLNSLKQNAIDALEEL